MVKRNWKQVGFITLCVLLAVLWALLLFLPFGKTARAKQESYRCVWQDGSVSEETYASAYPDLVCEDGAIRLIRGDLCGEIEPTEAYLECVQTLKTGGLAELLRLSLNGINNLERLALWRMTRGVIWYSSGYFVWGENGIYETDAAEGESLILLSGSITASRLKQTGATRLELRAEAELTSKTLAGTAVERVTAYAPYSCENGAVYLNTGTSVRLIAALPTAAELSIADCEYADESALLAAQNLQSLTLPFAGNSSVWSHSFQGELAYLFSDGAQYLVPASLKKVKITGGILVSHAFYRLSGVEEIDLCGMSAEAISLDALADCTALKLVHSPNANLKLSGGFRVSTAPCGCTVFERNG